MTQNTPLLHIPRVVFLRLIELAAYRAPILFILLFHAQRNPSLVVELLIYPPMCSLPHSHVFS